MNLSEFNFPIKFEVLKDFNVSTKDGDYTIKANTCGEIVSFYQDDEIGKSWQVGIEAFCDSISHFILDEESIKGIEICPISNYKIIKSKSK